MSSKVKIRLDHALDYDNWAWFFSSGDLIISNDQIPIYIYGFEIWNK